jgi:hypothetical protein
MKVYIGPYRDWIGPYQIADKIFFWIDRRGIWADGDPREERWDYKAADKLGDWLASTWVSDFCNWIDKFKKRKMKIRIDPYDTWSMDHTLAHIIHPMLVQLKNHHCGSCQVDPEDTPHIEPDPEASKYDDPKVHERWDWVLDEMIWTFESLTKDDEFDLFFKDGEWDMEGRDKYEERIKNGLRLFGKYYRGLWD